EWCRTGNQYSASFRTASTRRAISTGLSPASAVAPAVAGFMSSARLKNLTPRPPSLKGRGPGGSVRLQLFHQCLVELLPRLLRSEWCRTGNQYSASFRTASTRRAISTGLSPASAVAPAVAGFMSSARLKNLTPRPPSLKGRGPGGSVRLQLFHQCLVELLPRLL